MHLKLQIIASEISEEEVVETPIAEEIDYSAEIEALKASLAEKESELAEIKASEEMMSSNTREPTSFFNLFGGSDDSDYSDSDSS